MNHFSYLSYKECHDQDLFLEANGVSISSLIKNAGHLIATWVKENIKTKPLVGIIGKGKNGKDVLVAFEQIPDNKPLFLYLIYPKMIQTEQFKFIRTKRNITIIDHLNNIPNNAIILDGILGTGINRPPSKDVKEIISLINNLKNTRVSIDVPSGLCEKNDYTCIKADITLTMMFPKKVFLNQFKAIQCGKIIWLNFKLNQKEKNGYHLPNTNENYIDISEYIKKKNETH